MSVCDWSLYVELKHDDMAASNARCPCLSQCDQ